jgi:hypothetical protein
VPSTPLAYLAGVNVSCQPFPANPNWGPRFILMVDRGGCNFKTKVENAQAVGAVGVIVADFNYLCYDGAPATNSACGSACGQFCPSLIPPSFGPCGCFLPFMAGECRASPTGSKGLTSCIVEQLRVTDAVLCADRAADNSDGHAVTIPSLLIPKAAADSIKNCLS